MTTDRKHSVDGIIYGVLSLIITVLNLSLFAWSIFAWAILSTPPGQAGSEYTPTREMMIISALAIVGLILGWKGFQKAGNIFWKVVICLGGFLNCLYLFIAVVISAMISN